MECAKIKAGGEKQRTSEGSFIQRAIIENIEGRLPFKTKRISSCLRQLQTRAFYGKLLSLGLAPRLNVNPELGSRLAWHGLKNMVVKIRGIF